MKKSRILYFKQDSQTGRWSATLDFGGQQYIYRPGNRLHRTELKGNMFLCMHPVEKPSRNPRQRIFQVTLVAQVGSLREPEIFRPFLFDQDKQVPYAEEEHQGIKIRYVPDERGNRFVVDNYQAEHLATTTRLLTSSADGTFHLIGLRILGISQEDEVMAR